MNLYGWIVLFFLDIVSSKTMEIAHRKVAVIGGGPAGLATCKKLLDTGVAPKLFHRGIGGMWNSEKKQFWSSMKTNLSKLTCCFSDQPWSKESHMFPSQSDVHQYLVEYAQKVLDPEQIASTNQVTFLKRIGDGKFMLSWTDDNDSICDEEFDQVVIASGFFSKPILTESAGDASVDRQGFSKFKGRVIHSSEYINPKEFQDRNVVVAGSSFSSAEIAADIATAAKSVRNIVPKASWVIPRFLPTHIDRPNTNFIPVDLLFYQLDPRKDLEPGRREVLFKQDPDREKSNAYMQSLLGGPSRDIMKMVREVECERLQSSCDTVAGHVIPSVQVSISDRFATNVNSGFVELLHGYVHSGEDSQIYVSQRVPVDLSSCSRIVAKAESRTEEAREAVASGEEGTGCSTKITSADASMQPMSTLENVDDVIMCTGYTPALDFIDPPLLETIGFDPSDSLQPLLLHKEILHPEIPGLYFVGMYRGPYFAGMELQAQAVAAYISGALPLPSEEDMLAGIEIARQIRAQKPRPQFPHADYVGMCLDWMRALGQGLSIPSPPPAPSSSSSSSSSSRTGGNDGIGGASSDTTSEHPLIFTPALLKQGQAALQESQNSDLIEALAEFDKGKYLSQTVFAALQGRWHFDRILTSRLESSPSGVVSGTISFSRFSRQTPRMTYEEKGVFVTDNGIKLDVSGAQYTFDLNEAEDCIDLYFGDKLLPDQEDSRIFVSLKVAGKDDNGWILRGQPHLCGKDTYNVLYHCAFKGLSLARITIIIDVIGPFKDYTSHTTLMHA